MQREHEEQASLNKPLIETSEKVGYGGLNDRENGFNRNEIVDEVKKQIWLAGPLICVNLLQFCLQLISVMFVGHLGELPLSAASMATSFASVTGFSLLVSRDFDHDHYLIYK